MKNIVSMLAAMVVALPCFAALDTYTGVTYTNLVPPRGVAADTSYISTTNNFIKMKQTGALYVSCVSSGDVAASSAVLTVQNSTNSTAWGSTSFTLTVTTNVAGYSLFQIPWNDYGPYWRIHIRATNAGVAAASAVVTGIASP